MSIKYKDDTEILILFTYIIFIYLCVYNDNCYDRDTLNELPETICLDFGTVDVDFTIDNIKENHKVDTIHSSSHMLSKTLFKRIWISSDKIEYTTDQCLLFSSTETINFSSIESTIYDSEHRRIFNEELNGNFHL